MLNKADIRAACSRVRHQLLIHFQGVCKTVNISTFIINLFI